MATRFRLNSVEIAPVLGLPIDGEPTLTLRESLELFDAEPVVVVDLRGMTSIDDEVLQAILGASKVPGRCLIVVADADTYIAAGIHMRDGNGSIHVVDSMPIAALRSARIHRRLQNGVGALTFANRYHVVATG